jgi:hypothetical protein
VIVTVPVYVAGASEPAFTDTFTLAGVVPVVVSTVSQLPELPFVEVVTANPSAPGVPATAIVCARGAGPPCTCANVRLVGSTESVPAFTSSVTGIVTGLPDVNPEVEVIVTDPVYVSGANVEPSTFTVTVAGLEPVAVVVDAVALSQPEPFVVLTEIVNGMSVLLVATETVFGSGAAPPLVCENESAFGVTVMVAAVTVKVTGTVSGLSRTPVEFSVIELVYVPGARPFALTPMSTPFRPAAVLPPAEALSQGELCAVDTVKSRFVELVLVTVSVLKSLPFGATLKFSATGAATSIEFALAYIVTGIVTGLLGSATPVVGLMPVIVIVPVQVTPAAGIVVGGVTDIGNVAVLPTCAVVTPEESQPAAQFVCEGVIATVAEKLACAPVLLVTVMFCEVGLL